MSFYHVSSGIKSLKSTTQETAPLTPTCRLSFDLRWHKTINSFGLLDILGIWMMEESSERAADLFINGAVCLSPRLYHETLRVE